MPEINVTIQWDEPEDENWLNVYNILWCLQKECHNTKFTVTENIIEDMGYNGVQIIRGNIAETQNPKSDNEQK